MKKRALIIGGIGILFFIIWTIIVCTVDRQQIGVVADGQKTFVGLATMNQSFKDALPTNFTLYTATDWGSIPAVLVGVVFFILGVYQWFTRKDIKDVDINILFLGVFYVLMLVIYLIFLYAPINYRPVYIDGKAELSYPSSTTILSIGFLSTAILNNYIYIKKKWLAHLVSGIELAYMVFLIVGRLLSGVHWLSDIIGALILGVSLFFLYLGLYKIGYSKKENSDAN